MVNFFKKNLYHCQLRSPLPSYSIHSQDPWHKMVDLRDKFLVHTPHHRDFHHFHCLWKRRGSGLGLEWGKEGWGIGGGWVKLISGMELGPYWANLLAVIPRRWMLVIRFFLFFLCLSGHKYFCGVESFLCWPTLLAAFYLFLSPYLSFQYQL